MDHIIQVYDYLKSKRDLNLDTLKATIQVNCDYSDYVESVAKALNIDSEDCLEAFQALEAHERIWIMPQMEPYIDYIENIKAKWDNNQK